MNPRILRRLIQTRWLLGVVMLWANQPAVSQSFSGNSTVSVAAALSSVTNGTDIPAIAGSFETKDYVFSGLAVGFKNNVMYHSSYQLNFLRAYKMGEFLGVDVGAGYGLGLFYSKRGYRESEDAPVEEVEDYNGGFTIRIIASPGMVFMGMETFLGNPWDWYTRRLSSRDTMAFMIGARI